MAKKRSWKANPIIQPRFLRTATSKGLRLADSINIEEANDKSWSGQFARDCATLIADVDQLHEVELRGEASSAPASQEKQPTFGVVARAWNQVVWWQAIGGACIQRTVSFSTPDDAAKFYDALAAAAQPEGVVT